MENILHFKEQQFRRTVLRRSWDGRRGRIQLCDFTK